jgi:drug/metabolite transporter (DMT)-like permease
MNYSTYIGYFAIIGWIFISAIARVFTSELLQSISAFQFCFSVFFSVWVISTLSSIKHRKAMVRYIRENLFVVIIYNITTFCCWFFVIFPLKYIEPAMVTTYDLCIASFFSLLIELKSQNKNPKLIIICLLLFFGLILYMTLNMNEYAIYRSTSRIMIYISFLSIVVAGITLSINGFVSKQVLNSGNNTLFTSLSLRFPLIVLVSFIVMCIFPQKFYNPNYVFSVVILKAIFTYGIIPMVLIQISYRYISATSISLFISLLPVSIYLIQRLCGFNVSRNLDIVSIMCVSILSVAYIIIKPYMERNLTKVIRNGY